MLTFILNFPPRQGLDGRAFVQQVRERLSGLQGVKSVTASSQLPLPALACWLPARRAAGLDPTAALREE